MIYRKSGDFGKHPVGVHAQWVYPRNASANSHFTALLCFWANYRGLHFSSWDLANAPSVVWTQHPQPRTLALCNWKGRLSVSTTDSHSRHLIQTIQMVSKWNILVLRHRMPCDVLILEYLLLNLPIMHNAMHGESDPFNFFFKIVIVEICLD